MFTVANVFYILLLLLLLLSDRLYAVENARLVTEQENEDLHRELALVSARVSVDIPLCHCTRHQAGNIDFIYSSF